MTALRMGTRGSALARTQSGAFADSFTAATGVPVTTVIVRTEGDRMSTEGRAPSEGEETGIFTRALDEALRDGRVDFAVHSLKDVPTAVEQDLFLVAVPPRADTRDALVVASRHPGVSTIQALPRDGRVATSSPRRIAQLLRLRPDLATLPMAGNVDTRLAKLERGEADALVLASAGLDRLGRASVIARRLDGDELLGAPAQGALAVVCLASASEARGHLAAMDDRAARWTALAERSVLNALRGGCRAPVAASAVLEDGRISLRARVLSLHGRRMLEEAASRTAGGEADAVALGQEVADRLLSRGAADLIASART